MKRVYPGELVDKEVRSCNCGCGQSLYDPNIVKALINLAVAIEFTIPAHIEGKVVFYITSWNRCKERNAETKGAAPNSLHIKGKAIDFVVAYEFDNDEIAIPGEMVSFLLNMQFQDDNEIIIYKDNRVHLGISEKKVRADKR